MDPDNKRNYRAELDSILGVRAWGRPGQQVKHYERPANAPSWWHGDEEASDSFLAAMGVNIRGR